MTKKIPGTLISVHSSGDFKDDTARYLLSLQELLDITNLFYIETYQRPYSWIKKQVIDLLNDINAICESGGKYHFLSTIYLGKSRGSSIGVPIIDGQQRLITLHIICKVLSSCVKNNANDFDIKLKIDDKYLNIFSDKNKTDCNLLKIYKNAIKINSKIVNDFFKSHPAINKNTFLEVAMNNICFLGLELCDEKSEIIFFKNLNSKGLHLDEVDKIKAEILDTFYKGHEKNFLDYWSDINKCSNDKNIKRSSKLFLSSLMAKLSNTKKEKTPKYEDFLLYSSKIDAKSFRDIFSKKVKQFECFELDGSLIFSEDNNKNMSEEWKLFQVLNFIFQKIGFRDLFSKTIRLDYELYFPSSKNDDKMDMRILFLLFIFTYLLETNMSFTGIIARVKIHEFVVLSEKDRKSRLKEMGKKFLNDGYIDKINYFDKKTKKIVYVIYFLFLLSQNHTPWEAREIIATSGKLKELDHLLPKKPQVSSYGGKKLVCDNFSCLYSKSIADGANKVFNLLPLDKKANATKGNKIKKNMLKKDKDGKVCGIDEKRVKEIWKENEEEYIESVKKIIEILTK